MFWMFFVYGIFGIISSARGCSSVVERLLPKQDIVGSSPITRSKLQIQENTVIEPEMTVFYVSTYATQQKGQSVTSPEHVNA